MDYITTFFAAIVLLLFPIEAEEQIEYEDVTTDYGYYEYYEDSNDYYEAEYVVSEPYDADDGIDAYEFQYLGVIEEDGVTYTYYSENVLPGGGLTELNENGRHSEDGFVKDGDGYIAVASSDYEIGTVVDTPFGEGKVYDTGCAEGVVDIYVSF